MKNKQIHRNLSRQARRGFTLTEIAIVLGIIGLILGAIWAAAAAVYENLKFSQAQQGITLAAQQTRSLFASSNNTGVAANTDITAPGMLPTSWVSTGKRGNPWNQAPSTDLTYIIGNGSKFSVELDNIDNSGCASLLNFYNLTASSVQGGQIVGLIGSQYGTAHIGAVGTGTGAAAADYAPATNCTAGAQKNDVSIDFDMNNM